MTGHLKHSWIYCDWYLDLFSSNWRGWTDLHKTQKINQHCNSRCITKLCLETRNEGVFFLKEKVWSDSKGSSEELGFQKWIENDFVSQLLKPTRYSSSDLFWLLKNQHILPPTLGHEYMISSHHQLEHCRSQKDDLLRPTNYQVWCVNGVDELNVTWSTESCNNAWDEGFVETQAIQWWEFQFERWWIASSTPQPHLAHHSASGERPQRWEHYHHGHHSIGSQEPLHFDFTVPKYVP